jgi:Helix-turn-helix domain
VSVEPTSWALNLAPVAADRGGQPSSACKFVVVGLANHAGPDGTGAFPSVATLVRYTGLSERTVRTCLDRLEAEGIISPCDPDIVAARIKRADRRPQGWDLNLSLVRDDLDDAAVAVLEHQFLGLGVRLTRAAQPGGDGRSGGVQSPHPVATGSEAVDNWPDGVQQVHPGPGTGCNRRDDGVQLPRSRSAAVAPEPSKEPCIEPSAPARVDGAPAFDGRGGGPIGEFFAALGPAWRLTTAQRARLAPVVTAALAAGWTPRPLVAVTGANTVGVRNQYAVLTARLWAAELPPPITQPLARPPWCGECDQVTRMLGFDGDAPRPCPRCKPAAVGSRAAHAGNGRLGDCMAERFDPAGSLS